MKLKRRGVFKEMLHGNASLPSIFDFIKTEPSEDEEKVINYLRQGKVIIACGGMVVDIINPDNGVVCCPELKTDGTSVWSGELEYYVKQYHLKMDEEFLEEMRKNNWKIKDDCINEFDDFEIE